VEEERIREEPANCTMAMADPETLVAKEARVPGLQVMGVFTLCGLLAALGWGGLTGILVITTKAWTTRPPSEATDTSTSTEEAAPGGPVCPLKQAALSFRDERARWEWPRRTAPAGRRARRARAWENPKGQAG
jgi:hypothetical protein